MPKKKNQSTYTKDQLQQLAGSYKHSDNTMSIESTEANNVSEGDGISTKRPQ